MSSKRVLARLQVEVGHAVDGRPEPVLGALVGDARLAGALLAFQGAEGAHEDAVLDDELLRRRIADVVGAVGGRLAGNGGIEGDVHELGAVAQGADVRELHEGGAGVVALVAEDAVQLQGVAHGLVDLEHHLVGRQHEVRRHGRAFGGREQLQGLFRDPAGLGFSSGEIQEFPAPLVVTAPGPVGGTELGVAAFTGNGLYAEANDMDVLLDGGAGGGDDFGLDVSGVDLRQGLDDLVRDLHGLGELDRLPGEKIGAEGGMQTMGRFVVSNGGRPDLAVKAE